VYSSPNDKALGLAQRIFGSAVRLGQMSVEASAKDRDGAVALWREAHIAGVVDFIEFNGGGGFIGHDYFLSNPTVSADLALLIRGRLKTGDPARPVVEVSRPFWRISEKQLASQ
ncbi:MAG: alpha/beta hydrolase, partial [Bradyrhizobium sp.]